MKEADKETLRQLLDELAVLQVYAGDLKNKSYKKPVSADIKRLSTTLNILLSK